MHRFLFLGLAFSRATLTVDKLISERLAKLKNIGRSTAHINDTRHHLSRFALTFGNRPAGAIARQEIESCLETLQVGPRSYNNYCNRLNALFAFGCKKELLTQNPLTRIERKNVPPAQTQIIAPADLERLLERAPGQLVPALAISYFAGLRTAEILRLSWDDINLRGEGWARLGEGALATATEVYQKPSASPGSTTRRVREVYAF